MSYDKMAGAQSTEYPDAKTNPPVADWFQRVQKEAAELRELAEQVANRMSPVLMAEGPEPPSELVAMPSGASQFVDDLNDLSSTLGRVRRILKSVLTRCEL